jgi:hypothetical protein
VYVDVDVRILPATRGTTYRIPNDNVLCPRAAFFFLWRQGRLYVSSMSAEYENQPTNKQAPGGIVLLVPSSLSGKWIYTPDAENDLAFFHRAARTRTAPRLGKMVQSTTSLVRTATRTAGVLRLGYWDTGGA